MTPLTGLALCFSSATGGWTFWSETGEFWDRCRRWRMCPQRLGQGYGRQRHRKRRLIRSLDPLLRASDAGRVLFIASGVAHRAQMKPYWGPYAVSKAALEAIARTYAAETKTTGAVTVMLANPGPLRTRMRALAMPGEDPATLKAPEDFVEKALPLCSEQWRETGKLYDFQPIGCSNSWIRPKLSLRPDLPSRYRTHATSDQLWWWWWWWWWWW